MADRSLRTLVDELVVYGNKTDISRVMGLLLDRLETAERRIDWLLARVLDLESR